MPAEYVFQCANCGTENPVDASSVNDKMRCASCGSLLVKSQCLPVEVTDASFERTVLQPGPPVVLYLWGPNCGVCANYTMSVRKMAASLCGLARTAMINAEENPVSPGKYGLKGVPTLMVFKDGRHVRTLEGPHGERRVREALAPLIQSPVTAS